MSGSITPVTGGFRQSQYNGCTSLKVAATERFTGVATGTQFRTNQYGGCINLEAVPAETKLTHSGGSFRANQYRGCVKIVEPATEVCPTINGNVGDFRTGQYQDCVSLVRASPEEFDYNGQIIQWSFRAYQYSGCTALAQAADEVFNAPNLQQITYVSGNASAGFRFYQYQDCVSLKLPGLPTRGHPAELIQLHNYRTGQFKGCTSLEYPQEEMDILGYRDTLGVGSRIGSLMVSQYEGCTSLKRAPIAERVRYNGAQVVNNNNYPNVRSRQFFGCTSLVSAATEPTDAAFFHRSTGSFRSSQYENCTSLVAAPAEQPAIFGGTNTLRGSGEYRTAQYRGCTALSGYKTPKLETGTRQVAGVTYSASWRSGQFQLTPATNVAGNRVKFQDGVEAIPGTNVPNNIY